MKTILHIFAEMDMKILENTGIDYAIEEITLNENTYLQLVSEINQSYGNAYDKSVFFDYYLPSGKIRFKKSNKQRIELLKNNIAKLQQELEKLEGK